jgi:hypothetical protein
MVVKILFSVTALIPSVVLALALDDIFNKHEHISRICFCGAFVFWFLLITIIWF